MYIAKFEHIATGYPKQMSITFWEYLMYRISPNTFQNRMETKLGIQIDYEFFFNGVTYVR